MKILSRRDAMSALVTGLTTGVSAWLILAYLGATPFGIPPVVLVVVIPICWLVGVQFGYLLATMWRPMAQFGRFAAIGFANAAVDFGVLYLFIDLTGKADGAHYSLFKTISFSVATLHSYLWNKYWAFDAGRSHGGRKEVGRFLAVALLSVLVNVAAASLVVALRPGTIDPKVWASAGAAAGSATALIFSFIGFRAFVFNKK